MSNAPLAALIVVGSLNLLDVINCFHPNIEGKKVYKVHNEQYVTFFEAWRLCQGYGQKLATVRSRADSDLLEDAIDELLWRFGPWWIAGTDLGNEGHFVWITTNDPISEQEFINFSPGNPDNGLGIEHCLEVGLFGGVMWSDVNCALRRRFICEEEED